MDFCQYLRFTAKIKIVHLTIFHGRYVQGHRVVVTHEIQNLCICNIAG